MRYKRKGWGLLTGKWAESTENSHPNCGIFTKTPKSAILAAIL